jgi:hypothetical protein
VSGVGTLKSPCCWKLYVLSCLSLGLNLWYFTHTCWRHSHPADVTVTHTCRRLSHPLLLTSQSPKHADVTTCWRHSHLHLLTSQSPTPADVTVTHTCWRHSHPHLLTSQYVWTSLNETFVCLIVYSCTSNFSTIWQMSPLPVTELQVLPMLGTNEF